ncbi:MAG: DegT/DnrJ/EryC1/StrS family aminotransferase [Gammaproteobacteria bacterium]
MSAPTKSYANWPQFDADDEKAVAEVLRSGKLIYTSGPHGRAFENEFAEHVGSSFSVTMPNGTVALEAALHGCGVKPGDEVILSPRSYIASATSIIQRGARPVFVDVDADSQNLDVASIEQAVTSKTAAIMCVHLAGWPCDMPTIMAMASARNLSVIEDCAQAQGATIDGQQVGTFGDASAFSFCQDKIMTTGGEGGAVTTNDTDIQRRLQGYRPHDPTAQSFHPSLTCGAETRTMTDTQLRMTEIQSVVGRRQLNKVNEWQHIRRQHVGCVQDILGDLSVVSHPSPPPRVQHAYYRYYLFVNQKALHSDWNRERIVAEALALGLPCSTGTCPELYREKVLIDLGCVPERPLPVAHRLGQTSVALSLHAGLETSQVEDIAHELSLILRAASR